jgi:L-serine dehydratase
MDRDAMLIDDQAADSLPLPQLDLSEPPAGSDRRAFMMRSSLAIAIGALTGRAPAKEMNSKYKETSEGGLAASLTLC